MQTDHNCRPFRQDRRWLLAVFALLLTLQVQSAIAENSCAQVGRNTTYWVFGDGVTFNNWLKQCSEGKTAVEALIGAQARDENVQAAIRKCATEEAGVMASLKLDAMCQTIARQGLPKPLAIPAAQAISPQFSFAGLPPCVSAVQGKYKEYSLPDSGLFKSEAEIDSVWQMKDGKPFWTWTLVSGRTGSNELIGIEGEELVFNSAFDNEGNSAKWRVKIRFDATCESYNGTWAWVDRTGTVRGNRAGPL